MPAAFRDWFHFKMQAIDGAHHDSVALLNRNTRAGVPNLAVNEYFALWIERCTGYAGLADQSLAAGGHLVSAGTYGDYAVLPISGRGRLPIFSGEEALTFDVVINDIRFQCVACRPADSTKIVDDNLLETALVRQVQ